MVPIIAGILILILIFSIFSWDDNDSQENTASQIENQIWYELSLDTPTTESYVEYQWGDKSEIEEATTIYKWEKIIIKEGSVSMKFDGVLDLKLNKLGELKIGDDGKLFLYSSDLWVNTQVSQDISMRYANISAWANSTLSFSQNEMWSTIYLLTGFAEVSNLAGESTVLAPGQKISISRLEASKDDLDLQLSKENIDDYFKSTDWFIKNNGSFYLSQASVVEDETWTGETSQPASISTRGMIVLNDITDESQVSSPSIDITGSYTDEAIVNISANGVEATINQNNKTFKFTGIDTSQKENDIVFKVIDDAGDILEKFVYTLYYNNGSAEATDTSSTFPVQNYAVDATQFQFTAPTTANTYTTTEEFITIRGKVLNENVASVRVNGYQLKSYNGSTWRYHASTLNNNLAEGSNIYEIKYYDQSGKVIYTNYFTINKRLPSAPIQNQEPVDEKETQNYSDEA